MATVEQPTSMAGEHRTLISDVSYAFYKQFCEELGERPIRLSFADGMLEIMITKSPYEYYKTLLAKLVEATMFECNIPVRRGGNMTFQRDDVEKGFEPDECWWIAHEARVRGQREFDFQLDPPPDLAIEIEMSRALVNRLAIYAALGVPEIWRFNGKLLRFCHLQPDGTYADELKSLVFPFLHLEDLLPHLVLDDACDEATRIRTYVHWLRDQGHAV